MDIYLLTSTINGGSERAYLGNLSAAGIRNPSLAPTYAGRASILSARMQLLQQHTIELNITASFIFKPKFFIFMKYLFEE